MSGSSQLKLALLQSELHWESVEENLKMVEQKMELLPDGLDIIILSEMFSTGFTMNPSKVAEANSGRAMTLLKSLSADKGYAICGSFAAKEKGSYFNRFFWIFEGNLEYTYDKRHLFRMAEEHRVYSQGVNDVRIKFKGWNIMPRVCYDLRFPVWSRSSDVDLQIYVANWPAVRVAAWDKLLLARAIENQCYVAGVNRVGQDGNGIAYSGHSVAIDPKGDVMTAAANKAEEWIFSTLDLNVLNVFREKFPVALDADQFEITP
ncbi:amidohydrolase [Cryomorphaceae bacterium 1068]|nr:amidohydrolase [Cryomorphaceae bacterium 1068]